MSCTWYSSYYKGLIRTLISYVALFGWTLACWISFQPLILTRQESTADTNDQDIIQLIAKLLFAVFLCTAVLLGEKFAIQWIAGKFHERSYAGGSRCWWCSVISNLTAHRTDRGSEVRGAHPDHVIPPFA